MTKVHLFVVSYENRSDIMAKFILGSVQSSKTTYMLGEIRKRIENGEDNIIIIVPEQSTMSYEKLLLDSLGNRASAHVEILSFMRFARHMFIEYGQNLGTYARAGTKQLVMNLALSAVTESLSVFREPAMKEEFAQTMISAVGDLKAYNITPQMLFDTAKKCENERTSLKLSDIALVYEAYNSLLGRIYDDPADDLTRLAKFMSTLEEFGKVIYIDAFSGFTPQEYLVIEEIVRLCDDLTVVLTYDKTQRDNDMLSMVSDTLYKFEKLFERYDIKPEYITTEYTNMRPCVLDCISESFLTGESKACKEDASAFSIVRASDIGHEAEFAAQWIKQRVTGGARYSDFLILTQDVSSYLETVKRQFEKYGIPFYADKKEDITMLSPVRALMFAIEAVLSSFSYVPLFSYLKFEMGNYTYNEICELENYVLMWDISGEKLLKPFTKDPFGRRRKSSSEDDEYIDKRLSRLNKIRERVMTPISKFRNDISKAKNYTDMCRCIYMFMEESGFRDAIERASDVYLECGDLRKYDEYNRIYETLTTVLDEMSTVLGEAPCTLGGFLKLMKLSLIEYKLGSIPPTVDCVKFSSFERVISPCAPYVILMGATQDSLPKIKEDGGLFDETEREELGRIGLVISKSSYENASYDMYLAYCALMAAKRELVLTYPSAAEDGAENTLSQLIENAVSGVENLNYIRTDILSVKDTLYSRMQARELIASSFSENSRFSSEDRLAIEESKCVMADESDFNDWVNSVELYKNEMNSAKISDEKNLERMKKGARSLTATRVEKYSSCRFSYYLNYVLGIKKPERFDFTAADTGTFVHYILETFFVRIMRAEKSLAEHSAEEIDAIIAECVNDYLHTQIYAIDERSARFSYLFAKLTRSLKTIINNLIEELSVSSFVPDAFELEIGGDASLAAGVGEDETVKLYGLVDRVDVYKKDGMTYLRVIDYKTGHKKFDLNDVTYGLNIQMLFYLFTMTEYYKNRGEDSEAAGVLYFHAYEPVISAPKDISDEDLMYMRKDKLKRNGLVRADYELVVAMDNTISGASKYIPVSVNKDGTVRMTSSVATKEQFELIRKGVNKVIVQMAKCLEEGSIEISPYEKKDGFVYCQYCDYKSVCRFDHERGNRTRKIVKRSREEIFKMFGGEGSVDKMDE